MRGGRGKGSKKELDKHVLRLCWLALRSNRQAIPTQMSRVGQNCICFFCIRILCCIYTYMNCTVQTWVQSAAQKKYSSFTLPHQPRTWKYLIYTNPAQGFLPDRLQNTPKIPVFQSRTPKTNRYFSCAQSPRRAENGIFARWYKVYTVLLLIQRLGASAFWRSHKRVGFGAFALNVDHTLLSPA